MTARVEEVIGFEGGRDVRRRYWDGVLVEVHYLVGGKWVSPMDLLRKRIHVRNGVEEVGRS